MQKQPATSMNITATTGTPPDNTAAAVTVVIEPQSATPAVNTGTDPANNNTTTSRKSQAAVYTAAATTAVLATMNIMDPMGNSTDAYTTPQNATGNPKNDKNPDYHSDTVPETSLKEPEASFKDDDSEIVQLSILEDNPPATSNAYIENETGNENTNGNPTISNVTDPEQQHLGLAQESQDSDDTSES